MTRKILMLTAVAFLALFLQEAFFPLFLPQYAVPNLLLVLVLYLGFFEPNQFGIFGAFMLGFLLDLSGALVLGPWAGSFVATFCALSLIADRVFSESTLAVAVVGFAGAAVANVVYLLLTVEGFPHIKGAFSQIVWQSVVALIVLPLLVPWIRLILRGERNFPDYG